ncbi:MAG: alanine dehydrogenase [Acidobacteria bacterium]|nr:alanine dehydrogenase [Acidobacteriota bacterium]
MRPIFLGEINALTASICLRRETKNQWERRVALIPDAVSRLIAKGVEIDVATSPNRIFSDQAYREAGARVVADEQNYPIIIGIKEPIADQLEHGQTHLAFSHTIKGQPANMPLLRRFLEQKATLIDYETIKDDSDKRMIAFGRYAGIAGAADTLWVTGKKMELMGRSTALTELKQTLSYGSIAALKHQLNSMAPLSGEPVRFLIVGGGNSGKGAAEVMQWLGIPKIPASDVRNNPPGSWYALLHTKDVIRCKDGGPFDAPAYKQHGAEHFESDFEKYLGHFDVLIQTAFWDHAYPKHLDQALMKRRADELPIVIGDISCDVMGSLECTTRITTIDEPCMTYNPRTSDVSEGIGLDGPTVIAVDNLPCELSMDASSHFSTALEPMMPDLARVCELSGYNQLPQALARAVIVFRGDLTADYRYLEQYL